MQSIYLFDIRIAIRFAFRFGITGIAEAWAGHNQACLLSVWYVCHPLALLSD